MPAKANVVYSWDGTQWTAPGRDPFGRLTPVAPKVRDYMARLKGTAALAPTSWDWSSSNLPWAYPADPVAARALFTARWPSGVTVVPLQTGSSDFRTNLTNTLAAAGKRVMVDLGAGDFVLKSFVPIGSSGDPTYAFGYWGQNNLQGFIGRGPDKTFITMAPNSMTQAQLDKQMTMTSGKAGSPNKMGILRLDGPSAASPAILAGLTIRGADQQLLTTADASVLATGAKFPQPAAYNGVDFFASYPTGTNAIVSYVRFQGAGHSITSLPPFEHAGAVIQYGTSTWNNCEFDGRLSPDIDPTQPRRQGIWMGNNETSATHEDCWMHHSNLSRYAANDQNQETLGIYNLTRVKIDHISETNNGGLGGGGNPSCAGFESSRATITLTDCILEVWNSKTSPDVSHHISLTTVTRNPQGGRINVIRGVFRNPAFPTVDGYYCTRVISNTFWYSDGLATTHNVVNAAGQRKTAVVTASWPPPASVLAGITPNTHYLARTS